MRGIRSIAAFSVATAAILVSLVLCQAFGQGIGSPEKAPVPDLSAGGAKPSSIPNDAVTVVTLPGFHLAGAHVETGDICAVVSYQVVSDSEIRMSIKGKRTVDDKDNQCTIRVRTPGGSASTWIVVELTDAQQHEQEAREKARGEAKAEALIYRAGKTWHMTFAGGAVETYTSTGATPDSMPTFQTGAGSAVRISVADDGTVLVIGPGCMRTGTLVGTQVKDGQSQGECTPSGSWTATVVR